MARTASRVVTTDAQIDEALARAKSVPIHRAVKADPLWVPACLGLGATLIKLGRPDEAIEVYRRIISKSPRTRLLLARLLIDRARSENTADKAGAERRWGDEERIAIDTTIRFQDGKTARIQANLSVRRLEAGGA